MVVVDEASSAITGRTSVLFYRPSRAGYIIPFTFRYSCLL